MGSKHGLFCCSTKQNTISVFSCDSLLVTATSCVRFGTKKKVSRLLYFAIQYIALSHDASFMCCSGPALEQHTFVFIHVICLLYLDTMNAKYGMVYGFMSHCGGNVDAPPRGTRAGASTPLCIYPTSQKLLPVGCCFGTLQSCDCHIICPLLRFVLTRSLGN